MPTTGVSLRTLTPRRCSEAPLGCLQIGRKGAQNAWPRLDEDHLRAAGVDAAEVARQRVVREFGERARQFDARRSAADDDERQVSRALDLIGRPLRLLERQQQVPADEPGVFERLEAGRVRLPVVVAEVGVRRAGRDDQRVVVQLADVEVQDRARRHRRASASPSSTCTFCWRRRIHRIGDAMSPGDRPAVAT